MARVKRLQQDVNEPIALAQARIEAAVAEIQSGGFIVADAHCMATDDYSFPSVAAWAGPEGIEAVRATAARVASAAQSIIEAGTATHGTGGRAPGMDAALQTRCHALHHEPSEPNVRQLETSAIGGPA